MMFIKLSKYMNIFYEYKALLREKKENEKREKLAAIVIQKYYRGYKERRAYLIYKYFIKYIKHKIQLCSCKYLLKNLKKQKLEQQMIMYMSDNAIKIQKTFRGFYSRKYIHDFFKRKRQIIEIDNYVNEKKSKMLLELEEKRKKQLIYENKLKDMKIHKVAKNLHHLVSTKAQRGVYNLKIENIIKEQQGKIEKKDKNYTKK
ncbi:conserved Plasmodium protein, unknown function [Plasmodium gallinaceum]|uniref:Calmodulin binding protein n=1 Tax=Plasmodium gallinaceum TaxID=5849 RepID=A0A1J1GY03_PLAGA|nr:conserved Plasmodium protein, unknown function [Plasmodium gallinaceum]CRG96160.1 conserved Plasmodium protein, unknown function [Plasmodium gallinaceum]